MSNKVTIDAYNKIADDYNARNTVSINKNEIKIFKSFFEHNFKILDVGCGTGRDAEELIKEGFRYTGIDASEGMLKIAQERTKDLRASFEPGDFYKLNFRDQSFDGFWAAAAFLHVPKSEIGTVLQEAKRILKDGGIGFISLKQKTVMDEGVIKEGKSGGIERYFAFYDEIGFKKILEKNHFKVLKVVMKKENDKNGTIWLCFFVQK